MIAQSNVTHMLVGKDDNIAASTETRGDLAIGEIGVFLVGSSTAKATTVLTTGQRYSIAFKNAKGVIIETPILTYGSETSKSADTYVAPTQRVRTIGYSGSAGSIAVSNSTNYVAHIFWKDNSKAMGRGTPVKFAAYYSDAASSQAEIATGLAVNFNKNFAREVPKLIKAEILTDEAGAALTGTGDVTVVNGSKYATAATDVDALLAVGDYVRFGGLTTSFGVYKVTALDTTNQIMTLNMPYQGISETLTSATETEYVTAATMAASEAGVKLTALATTSEFEPGIFKYDVIDFEVELKEEFGATTVATSASPSVGVGTYWEVAENEWFLKGNRGETWRNGRYPKAVTLEATSGKTYNYITVEYSTSNSKTIDRNVLAFGSVLIATEVVSSGAIHANLKTILGIS